ncbi:UAP56-interacting factor isoform X3 [Hyla sarda]|uniref:UAP56-interacting factor isoform X3 n=1 Tax=Hyla sarda TaxID=327740 RepID=UPI0024C2BDAF|nr:UAP56-interacting factor isoform X3 [Hyla sarda]
MVPSTSDMTDIDKIDMSLDDIIKLNKQEQQSQALFNGGTQTNFFQQFRNKGKWGARRQTGAGNMGVHKRPYGVKTALRRMSSWSGVGHLNRSLHMRNSAPQRLPFRRRINFSRPMDLASKSSSAFNRYPFNSYSNANTFRSGVRMRQQRDTRQATYFLRRGLKVQAGMESAQHEEIQDLNRKNAWRTSMNRSGLLTVSFGNPSALPSSSMGTMLPRPPLPFLLKKEGAEPKVPKGVPLDFDINSVAKQTGITLNERFKILKEQRLSQPLNKGSRFVTVG